MAREKSRESSEKGERDLLTPNSRRGGRHYLFRLNSLIRSSNGPLMTANRDEKKGGGVSRAGFEARGGYEAAPKARKESLGHRGRVPENHTGKMAFRKRPSSEKRGRG